jgi:hypothetical protein
MIYGRFRGPVDREGVLTLRAEFLATGQRFQLLDHRTCTTLICQNSPLDVLTEHGLLDSNQAPPLQLARGARFTALVFDQGNIVGAVTYEFDGQVIVERAQVGEWLSWSALLTSAL